MGLSDEQQTLIRTIRAAFQGVERGDGISISEAHVIDGYGCEEARRLARRSDPGGAWEDLPRDHLEYGALAIVFLDGEGLRYYLPAFMVHSVIRPSESDLPDLTIQALVHPPSVDERFELLSARQREAVCLFLRYFADAEMALFVDTDAARRALERGWACYC
jgi:hypothetical protein